MDFIPAAKGNYIVQIIDARSSTLKWISLGCSSSPGEQPCSTPLQPLETFSYFQPELAHSHFIPISSCAKAALQLFLCPCLAAFAQKEHIPCQSLFHHENQAWGLSQEHLGGPSVNVMHRKRRGETDEESKQDFEYCCKMSLFLLETPSLRSHLSFL